MTRIEVITVPPESVDTDLTPEKDRFGSMCYMVSQVQGLVPFFHHRS